MLYTIYKSSYIGDLLLYGEDGYLKGLELYSKTEIDKRWVRNDSFFKDTIKQLDDYFEGKIKNFSTPLKPKGTKFQLQVFEALLAIPYGEVVSYKDLAKMINNPNAQRAVGNALNKNPIAIIIPCHRVISSSGDIGGFGGGIEIKKKLLALEGVENV